MTVVRKTKAINGSRSIVNYQPVSEVKMVLVELSIYPMDKGEHLSLYVARAVKIIKESGLNCEIHAMGTLIEGEWKDVISVVDKCYKELEKDCNRIIISFKADCKKGKTDLIKTKVKSVENKLK